MWNAPGEQKNISDQVGDLCEQLQDSGDMSGVVAIMRGLALIDRGAVHDEYTDAREWNIASAALRRAFAEAEPGEQVGPTIINAMVDELERTRVAAAEEDDDLLADPLLKTISKTHQRDRLHGTVWDAERCAAASAVAAIVLRGTGALTALADEVHASLSREREELVHARTELRSSDADARMLARRDALPFLSVFVGAAKLRLTLALERTGWRYVDGPGPGVFAKSDVEGFWVRDQAGTVHHVRAANENGLTVERDVELPEGARRMAPPEGARFEPDLTALEIPSIEIEIEMLVAGRDDDGRRSKSIRHAIDPKPAAFMMALGQLVDLEAQLFDDAIDSIDAELARIEATRATLGNTGPVGPQTLQILADTLLFAARNAPGGLNLLPVGKLLSRAGLDPEYDASAPALSLSELALRSQPGEAYLLASKEHAAAYLHLTDGRRLVFDSEGVFGIKERPCLATYDPYDAPKRTEALDRHYGKFYGLVRLPLTES